MQETRGQNSKPKNAGVFTSFFSSQAVQSFCSIPVVSLHFVVWFLESLLTRLGPRLGHHLRRTSDFLFARAFWLEIDQSCYALVSAINPE